MTRRTQGRSSSVCRGLVAVLVLLLGSGCTMCPDPFDYSGPVPNGSPPQNDFAARSNGILPLHNSPKPWPPVVKRDQEPTPAAPLPPVPPAVADAPVPDESVLR
jgi:hypothetical protein